MLIPNGFARGFDLGSEAIRRQTLEHARDTGETAATAPIELVQASGAFDGLLIVRPVYERALPAKPTVAERRQYLRGFVAAAIRAQMLVGLAIQDRRASQRVHLRIVDSALGKDSTPLFSTQDALEIPAMPSWARRLGLKYDTSLAVAGRRWILHFTPTLEYLAQRNSLLSWLVLAEGLSLSALVGAGALALTGRTAAVEALVRERTAELAQTNERLAKADKVKSEFISTVSHELRTPLTSIRGSLGLLNAGATGEVLPPKAQQLVEVAYRNTDRLTLLIDDILDIEKIDSGKLSLDLAPHSLAALVEQAVA